jgi:hypothetical protein
MPEEYLPLGRHPCAVGLSIGPSLAFGSLQASELASEALRGRQSQAARRGSTAGARRVKRRPPSHSRAGVIAFPRW